VFVVRRADRIRTCDPLQGSNPVIGRCRMSPKTLGFPYVYREPGGSLASIVRGRVDSVTVVLDGFLMGK